MSFSLQLEHGDLTLSGNSLGTVVGAAKLQQDLVCWILTPLGFEELHPTYGSVLVENLENPEAEIIGSQDFRHAATLVQAELLRICHNYQAQQVARNEQDGFKFGRSTLSAEEVLLAVQGVQFTQAEDKLLCVLKLEIGNEVLTVSVPLPESIIV